MAEDPLPPSQCLKLRMIRVAGPYPPPKDRRCGPVFANYYRAEPDIILILLRLLTGKNFP